jgi:[ribosomal protein S5]-alanine N-acetyltransferase
MTTKRCHITPISESDFDEVVPLFTNTDVRRYLGGTLSIEEAINKLKDKLQSEDDICFTVREKKKQVCIGLVYIAPHHNPADMEISYMFLPEFWGMGYAYEVIKRLLEYCREELQLKHVVAETQTANLRSCHLLEKLGYRPKYNVKRFGADQSIYVYDLNDFHSYTNE